MKFIKTVFLFLLSFIFAGLHAGGVINHHLYVKIQPETSSIEVIDSLDLKDMELREFLLNSAFQVTTKTPGAHLTKLKENVKAGDIGMDHDADEKKDDIQLTRWQITGNPSLIVLSYQGNIKSVIEQSKANYQRGFAESSGIISDIGIYLAGSTYWVPQFDGVLSKFVLTTELPSQWKTVSQGKRIFEKSGDKHIDTWKCDKPQEEIFLIGAKFYEYSYQMNNGILAMAFLRSDDEALANKYLEVTEQYMDMYQGLLGNYPYSKFALVENFWETGYGMPSFTLLGEKIIRFPFILYSSYPHELLHNWWGNSVYVDFDAGNWCEGTTAFMADHLIKEQRGAGEEYRRSILQKFSNFVTPGNDFPLSEFVSRHDGPSEAIGYGKALMMWQMLRRKLGDQTFVEGMRKFYQKNIFHFASYDDIRRAMEEVSGEDLQAFFAQWVKRKGAPELAIERLVQEKYGNNYRIRISLKQVQEQAVFDLDIPIGIATQKGTLTKVVNMNRRQQEFQLFLKDKPLKVVVDPQYDVFRILNPAEVPPTLSKIWGSEENVFILPSQASKSRKKAYRNFAEKWKEADNDHFTIVFDNEITQLPSEKTAWVLGFENRFASAFRESLKGYHAGYSEDSVYFGKQSLAKKNTAFVYTLFKKNDIRKQDIFIAFDNTNAIAGLIRKLPHYGKYSYLAFTGDEPVNVAKGEWAVVNSPLVRVLDEKGSKMSVREKRAPLAELKPVFSKKKMMNTIKFLASPELKGRGLGTPELEKATTYIEERFKEAGLHPPGENYRQTFTHVFDDKGKMTLTNVVGYIPGNDPELKNDVVVLSAHYDHLGLGWPDVHQGDEGKIHPGADDNASGVAILLELARTMGKTVKPKRTIVFLACTGEEAGLIGSRYFVKHFKDYFKGEIFADLNIDTDGSLFDKKLMVLNANTAKEWKYIFMGTDYTTGVRSEVISQDLDASDQVAFIEKQIPAVQLFTGATPNYHRPTDTPEKIDGKGLVKVASVSKEVITYLADREDPMPFTGTGAEAHREKQKRGGRKVSTGSVPDFAYGGKGVKIGSLIPGSAGEKAGLKVNDIIIAVDGQKVENLKDYSILLKKYAPGDKVAFKVIRNGKEKIIRMKLGAR